MDEESVEIGRKTGWPKIKSVCGIVKKEIGWETEQEQVTPG